MARHTDELGSSYGASTNDYESGSGIGSDGNVIDLERSFPSVNDWTAIAGRLL
jgi:hypothetical protein